MEPPREESNIAAEEDQRAATTDTGVEFPLSLVRECHWNTKNVQGADDIKYLFHLFDLLRII